MSTHAPSPEQAVRFSLLVEQLKVQKRTGWIRMDVKEPESIADHMYRMGIMALVAGEASGLDPYRCMRIAITHDLAEAIVGDITPHCGVPKEEKHRREVAAIETIKEMLGGSSPAAEEVGALWEEYEGASTPYALLLKDLDKLEMILQAYEYERAQGVELQEFFASTRGKFTTPIGQQWAAEVVHMREAASNGGGAEASWSPPLAFFTLLSNLKRTKRRGWLLKGVEGAESIADHMYRMAMMALVLGSCDPQVDGSRCIAMALAHDLAEAVVGDITPHCGVSKEDKLQLERQALQAMVAPLLPLYPSSGKLLEGLWEEFEAGASAEALLVNDLDKLEMILQAHQYETSQGFDLQGFFDSTNGFFKTPATQQWAQELARLRQEARSARLAAVAG